MMNEQPMWRVSDPTDVMDYTPQAGTHRAKKIVVTFADGNSTYITVPIDKYTPEEVNKRAHEAAITHAQVLSLQGPDINGPISETPPPIR